MNGNANRTVVWRSGHDFHIIIPNIAHLSRLKSQNVNNTKTDIKK